MNRRTFIQASALATIASLIPKNITALGTENSYLNALQPNDLVALATPLQSISFSTLNTIKQAYENEGFRFLDASQTGTSYGYYTDQVIAQNLNQLFQNPTIKAVALLPGSGLARLLPLLDFQALWNNPKLIIGVGQSTILHFATYATTQLNGVFVSPTALLNPRNLGVVKSAEKKIHYPALSYQTISGGFSSGILMGGNLSALTELIGTSYFPNLENKILIVEENNEESYRIDRMLTQLRLSGTLHRLSGFIFSSCVNCNAYNSAGTMQLKRILYDHFGSIGIPVGYGQVLDKEGKQLFALGVRHEFDAQSGVLTQLQSAVKNKDTPYRPE